MAPEAEKMTVVVGNDHFLVQRSIYTASIRQLHRYNFSEVREWMRVFDQLYVQIPFNLRTELTKTLVRSAAACWISSICVCGISF